MDYNFITERLATGAALTGLDDVGVLVAAGIDTVIDCRAEMNDAPLFTSFPQITYVWAPTQDDGQPKSPTWFGQGLSVALPALGTTRHKVYAHCAAGINRGPSMALAILLAWGFSEAAAVEAIRGVRPQVGLAYQKDAVAAVKLLGYV